MSLILKSYSRNHPSGFPVCFFSQLWCSLCNFKSGGAGKEEAGRKVNEDSQLPAPADKQPDSPKSF